MKIEGYNDGGIGVNVDDKNRIQARSVSLSEQAQAAVDGDSYNLNTGTITFTDDLETPVFFIKNLGEPRKLLIPRVFMTFGSSNGVGEIEGALYFDTTTGFALSGGTDKAPENFNASSKQLLDVDSRVGATGLVFGGGSKPVEFLFPSDSSRWLVGFEEIVLGQGTSMMMTIKPPAGNTSMKLQCGCNIYLGPSVNV